MLFVCLVAGYFSRLFTGVIFCLRLRSCINNNDERAPPSFMELHAGTTVAYFRRFIFSAVSTIKYRVITFLFAPFTPVPTGLVVCVREYACALQWQVLFRSASVREKNGGNQQQTLPTQICAAAISEMSSRLAIC